ncbi:hypothetical protein I4U23_011371 [Adineta vaga]|nr:hypothetical protein I4U23_011371 [Adineta vaga]
MDSLPVEILYRIFDNLDAQTIIFSVRCVCRLFGNVVHTYDRYRLDFKSIYLSDFHLLCRLIHPQNVRSLILCNSEYTPNEINLFLSTVRLRQFTRLHSLTLIDIEEFQMNMILKRINLDLLKSFSLHIHKYDDRRAKTTLNFLSSIVTNSNIRNLELNIKPNRLCDISWPIHCRIKYLSINDDISFNDLCQILTCSPQLRTLIIGGKLLNYMIQSTSSQKYSFPQLTSVTFNDLNLTNNELELFLLSTPSLIYLKVIGDKFLIDGNRWEQFIEINLSQLDRFEFFMNVPVVQKQTHADLDAIIQSFQSPFWIQHKKWFVVCEFTMSYSYKIQIYSIPICKTILEYKCDEEKVFVCSNSTISSWYDDSTIRNNSDKTNLLLKLSMNDSFKNKEFEKNKQLFPKVTKLHIDIERRFSVNSMEFLMSLIDISRLVEVKLESFTFNKLNKHSLFEAITIIERSPNLSSLIIRSRYSKSELYVYLNDLCSILPCRIKYLQIPVNQLHQVETIIERCPYLSVVKFEISRSKLSEQVIEWFTNNTINSVYRKRCGCDIIWIGKKKTNEIECNHKRIKLNDDNQIN